MRSAVENRNTVSSTARVPSAEALENAVDLASPCSASNGKSCFKENVNINKYESPKLSLEPLQMKRKKKGGGYNLRKSLAWDRAFFTEEGILDPLELSIISDASCREGMPFISEDTSGGSQQNEDLGKDRKNDWLSPECDSSSFNLVTSTSVTSRKIPTYLGSKPVSRCGDCPRPPSPSLKRPANVNASKTAGKELKLLKVLGLKPGLSPTCTTTRSKIHGANHVKHNQITQPDFSIPRHAELKSSHKSLKNTENASRANTLQSAHHSYGNSGSSSLKRHSSINMSPSIFDKANNSGLKMISDNATPARPENSSQGQQHDSTTFAASCSRNAQISSRNLHPLQNQTIKPSGLRMPSPSLSFFSQPKPYVFPDLPLRDSDDPGKLRMQDNMNRTPKTYSRILESTISSSKAISSRSECTLSSHVSVTELIKPKLEQNPMHKSQDLPKKNTDAKISYKEAELQKISIQVSSQSGFPEQATDKTSNKAFAGGWRNAELGSKQNYAIQESETISANDEPPQEKNRCSFFVSNHGSTQCAGALDDGVHNTLIMHSDWGKTSKPYCHESQRENTGPLKYSLQETDDKAGEDKKFLKERASEQLGVPQQNGRCCSGSIKPLEQRQAKADNLYFGSKHLYSSESLTDNLPVGDAYIQSSVFSSTIQGYKNDSNMTSKVGDAIKQPGNGSEVRNICLKVEMESEKIVKSNTSDRLLPEKQLSIQNSQQEESVEELLFVVPDRKDGDKVNDNKIPISLSPGERHDSYLGKEKITAQSLVSEFSSVDNSLSFESNSLNSMIFNCDHKHMGRTISLNTTTYESLSNRLCLDTQTIKIDNCSPLPESRMGQLSQTDTPGKVTEGPCIQDCFVDDQLISTMSLKDGESNVDKPRGLPDTRTVLVQSPEINMLNGCYFKQSEHMTLARDEFVAKDLVHDNDHLHTTSPADVYSEDNALGSSPAKGSPREHGCHDASGTGAGIADAITDSSRVESFPDTVKGDVSENANSSFSCLYSKLDQVKAEAALAPNNKRGELQKEKSLSHILPRNAIPFSDEWLAAIEAAGEDILTRKSGAVQNSPPDKSLPEPSPWSPVKRKNNQIGPFDCTKFTAPSGSN